MMNFLYNFTIITSFLASIFLLSLLRVVRINNIKTLKLKEFIILFKNCLKLRNYLSFVY
jgi:hypothetical protein